ncbi:membrane protein [Gordoniibacillus kamchatkensis]|uniref:Membrane protein n=1 Tax=Gordoniibacillus kamchatkensis TaxID=1590651 RepID=A0ABR5AAG5_9BACL|nr:stage II sporulation protein M [Paenibacillus sp. VKM B-2647]KIL38051.1 membrane protein [Paenibacillus sp. VKM B-2647]
MELTRFIKANKPLWSELEQLLQRFGSRRGRLQSSDIDRLAELYQAASSHLSSVRDAKGAGETAVYLNHLVSRAHHALYQETGRSGAQLRDFFGRTFPDMLRRRQTFIAAALLLFLIGALSGFLAVRIDPLNAHVILPGNMASSVDPSQTDKPRDNLHSPIVSTLIMSNNIRVAVLAFIGGVTLGAGTVYLLLTNGLLLGALAAVFFQVGRSYVFWAYILPHGIIELTAIFIAGGAGMYMGYRFLVPGPFPRRRQFLRSAKESVQLLMGTVPLFVIAGIIEGYITPSTMPLAAKYAVAGVTLLLVAAYYVYGLVSARNATEHPSPSNPNMR